MSALCQPEAARQPQVVEALAKLRHEINELKDKYIMLQERLKPVCIDKAKAASIKQEKPSPNQCLVASDIENLTDQVRDLRFLVMDTINEVEV